MHDHSYGIVPSICDELSEQDQGNYIWTKLVGQNNNPVICVLIIVPQPPKGLFCWIDLIIKF